MKEKKLKNLKKGLVHGFAPKLAFFFFQFVISANIAHQNVCSGVLERKNAFQGYKEKKFKKIKKLRLFPKVLVHGLLQKWPFSKLLF